MKQFLLSGLVMFVITIFSVLVYADSNEITKLSDYKKVQVQFTKSTVLKLAQFVRDTGRKNVNEKNPNYRLLHESDKLSTTQGVDTISCTVYQKTMLSNRTPSYTEEAAKYEKMITDKAPLILSEDTTWTISRISPNELGVLVWLQAEKKSLQIDCEKKNAEGKEVAMLPTDVLTALTANDVKFVKDGKELKPAEAIKTEAPSDLATPPTSTPES